MWEREMQEVWKDIERYWGDDLEGEMTKLF